MIQHSNDVLNLNRPPSPQHPPPDDDHDRDNDSSTDEDGQDVDLTSRVVEPARYEEPPIETEITSRSSMNFRVSFAVVCAFGRIHAYSKRFGAVVISSLMTPSGLFLPFVR